MATNSKPISVAPADAPTMKKFSQPWNILALKPEAALFYGDSTPGTLEPRLVRGFLETIHASSDV